MGTRDITIMVPITIDATGAYPESIGEIKAAITGIQQNLPRQIGQTMRENCKGYATRKLGKSAQHRIDSA